MASDRGLMETAGAAALALFTLGACRPAPPATPHPDEEARPAMTATTLALDDAAEPYVRLVLAMGGHDPDYVDAYYGPPAWREEETARARPLAEIRQAARQWIDRLAALDLGGEEEILRWRSAYLRRQLEALEARARFLEEKGTSAGAKTSFDEESQALYDAVSPRQNVADLERVLADVEALVPGDGPLAERYNAWRDRFVVPKEKLDTVFRAAIAECRRRSLPHLDLPPGEDFRIEYVTGKSWSGYNWYQGGFKSLIQVNTDLPVTIDRAVHLACHEGYPGHHAYNALLEKHLVEERGWPEFSVYPLFSPQSLIAEGTANFGVEVAFPGDERLVWERDVLFPLAGLDPTLAAPFAAVNKALERLSYAENEAARRYLEGEIDRAATADWLVRYTLASRPRAEQRVRFFDQYRSYVINYNLGKDLVRAHVEARGGTVDHPDVRWREFVALLASPRLPGGLAGR